MSASSRRRHRRHFKRRTQPGAPPGVLVSDPGAPRPHVTAIAFGAEGCQEQVISEVAELRPLLEKWPLTWINVDGVGDAAMVQEIGSLFGFHRLALEDVVHVHQRAKAEHYGDVLFVVAQMPLAGRVWETEQISLFIGRNFVVSFQERPGGDCLDMVRARIRSGMGRVKAALPGHLMYALLDAIIDNYFPLVEECGERLDTLEERALGRPDPGVMEQILDVKRDLRLVRRVIWPLRDALNTLLREESPLIGVETRVYLRDCHDHTIQILDLLESYRELAAGLTDLYLSNLSNSTNEIMKVLTIISTIFIPLTFIVGVYGMNFDRTASPWNMPELGWAIGYPLVCVVMLCIAAGQLLFFRRRGWIGRRFLHRPPE